MRKKKTQQNRRRREFVNYKEEAHQRFIAVMVHASIVLNAVEGASLSCWTAGGHGTAQS
jgi:hypothetical protein